MSDLEIFRRDSAGHWRTTPAAALPPIGSVLRFSASDLIGAYVPGVSPDRGDANITLVNFVDFPVQRFATTLTANRTVTLPTADNYNGAFFRIVRTGLGSFTLAVGTLLTIASATAAWVDIMHDGTAWRLIGYGEFP